jgi:hypothetical protein
MRSVTDEIGASMIARSLRENAALALYLLVVGDTLVFLIFAAGGRNQHHESGGLVDVVTTALPFLVAWFVVAPWFGAFRPPATAMVRAVVQRMAMAWIVAWILGLALRVAVQQRGIDGAFPVIALLFNAVLLLGWRAAFTWYLTRPRGRPAAG